MAPPSFRGLIPGAFPESFVEEHPLQQSPAPFPTSGPSLYHPPQYRYPHTLSFLGRFSPEDEARIIRQFQQAADRQDRTVPPPVSSFQSSFGNRNAASGPSVNSGGWTEFAPDLVAMGLGWAAKNLGLDDQDVTIEVVQYEDKATQIERVASTSAANVSEYAPTFSTATTIIDSAPESPPGPPRHLLAPGNWHDGQYTTATTVSDTEEDTDAESFANKYIGRGHTFIENPVSVFGPGAVVDRSIGGRIHAHQERKPRRLRKNRVTKRSPKPIKEEPKSSFAEQLLALMVKPNAPKEPAVKSEEKPTTDIKYPTLPTLSDRDTKSPVPYKLRELGRRPPDAHTCPGLPPVQPSTPAGYDPSYRYRRPNDTRFHHGSAGVNPLGTHSRVTRIKKEQAGAPSTARNGMFGIAVRRHHRIVSGSFGSFEVNKPSRFDERKYRLLQRGKKKDKMEED